MNPMFTVYTYQDWEKTPVSKRGDMLKNIVQEYKQSTEFQHALTASQYFRGENSDVMGKTILQSGLYTYQDDKGQSHTMTQDKAVVGARVPSNFFFRFVTQQNQFLLANGVTLKEQEQKDKLGFGFDKALEQMGEKALVQGVCWAHWNNDHVEIMEAARDKLSGFVALVDERNSQPRLGVQFWQIGDKRPMYIRLFEEDGVSVYSVTNGKLRTEENKRAYVLKVARDAAGEQITGAHNYGALPLIPLYANGEQRSELSASIKAKIDAYDRIASDFVDNLDKTNDVLWTLNNFGGSTREMAEMVERIRQLGIVANYSDGMGGNSSAEATAFEVPYAARKTALELLENALYADYMAMNMDEITGGSLTNVAIQVAMTNMELKADRYEWQVFQFMQRILHLLGVDTEEIKFRRQTIVNESEIIADIYTMRADIDRRTALTLNPRIAPDEVDTIMNALDMEELAGNTPTEE